MCVELEGYELELYDLITGEYVSECGWVSDREFLIWIDYLYVYDFIKEFRKIFGNSIFDGDVFNANLQPEGICFDLCFLSGAFVDLETVFPKKHFRH